MQSDAVNVTQLSMLGENSQVKARSRGDGMGELAASLQPFVLKGEAYPLYFKALIVDW